MALGCEVVLTFFKPSGKYYTEHRIQDVQGFAHEIIKRYRDLHAAGKLPGVSSGGNSFHVVIEVDGVPTLSLNPLLDAQIEDWKTPCDPCDSKELRDHPHSPECRALGALAVGRANAKFCMEGPEWGERGDDYGDVMTREDFVECCEGGGFTNDDGYGYLMKDGKTARGIVVKPSDVVDADDAYDWHGATHVVWFNK